MPQIFKKKINRKEYSFHRTLLVDQVVYHVLFDHYKKRSSFKIAKDNAGAWQFGESVTKEINQYAADFITAVVENERQMK